ncbi:pentatricopeptide repeat-containing protein At2g39620 [Humulus lupulus]|uniref:pentatricopeptide repeat-containing protein At2g39620 n=1 Tax=Humulus lupulus TaxID=3486 RepID=UPI002B416007|nr:pentatricopeptide repeat-containing protein At2g39620 [Humulus lupulus]
MRTPKALLMKYGIHKPHHTITSLKNHSQYIRLLNSCKNFESLLQIHGHLVVSGLREDSSILTHLINAYSFFHKCDISRLVFDSMPNPTIILWNSMIRAYTMSKRYKDALEMYHCMLDEGLEPDKYTFNFVVKACTGALNLQEGILIHREIVRRNLESDVFIGTSLIDFYCKTGELSFAREVFDGLPRKDGVACNAMIAGFSQSSDPSKALVFFRSMQFLGLEPNSVSLLNLVPAVCRLGDFDSCRSIHGYAVKRDFGTAVSNGLIDMYSKCGSVNVALRVFNAMHNCDDISWGTLMAGLVCNRRFFEVLELFECMKFQNLKLNKVSVISALLAAAELRDLEKGKEVHNFALQEEIHSDILVITPIITMYAKCGQIEKAKELFDKLQEKDLIALSALLSAFLQSGYYEEVLSLFRDCRTENLTPDGVTLSTVLSACVEVSSVKLGKSIHCYAVKANIDCDISIGTALVSMYAKCGFFTSALILFDRMPSKDIVTWNALINAYTQNGEPYHAVEMFRNLQLSGIQPDAGTMVGLIPACTVWNDLDQGACIHGKIIKSGLESDSHVQNSLIGMYAKCGSLSSAACLFNRIQSMKDEVSWNVIIAGYAQSGYAKEAISAFHQMKLESLRPNSVTIVSVLPAVAYLSALSEGVAIHAYITKMGFLSNTLVRNSLIDMYAKCGLLDFSERCFNEMEQKDNVSFNVMLAGYAVHGRGNCAVSLFSLMQESYVQVDKLSFISVLSACRHSGLVKEGRKIFQSMHQKHLLDPNLEHYACMVDLLGRAGLFDEALNLISTMPMEPDAGVWGALLGACRIHSNAKLGEVALNNLVKFEPGNLTNYIVLSNIYTQSGRWRDADKINVMIKDSGLKKTPGCTWVEIKNKLHTFRVGDQSHPQFESMCFLWNKLLEKMENLGYVPDRSCVLQNVEEEDKDLFLYNHSERLAITFALLNTEPGSTIHLVKNLRVCVDCHSATKYITKVTNRSIIVRDAIRFHHFEDGICSCKDYW